MAEAVPRRGRTTPGSRTDVRRDHDRDRAPKRHRWVWLLVALLVIAAIAVAGFFLLGGDVDVDGQGGNVDIEAPETDIDVDAPNLEVNPGDAEATIDPQ